MISLSCTHCQRVLTIDEAFAGGVCRCQHCGTIQTVPSHLKDGDKEKPGPSGKSLYKHPRTGGGGDSHVGTGLANLQDESAKSSPMPGRRERAPRAVSPGEAPQARPPIQPWQIYAALAGIVLAGLFLIWLILAMT
jgi:hypothetical protein